MSSKSRIAKPDEESRGDDTLEHQPTSPQDEKLLDALKNAAEGPTLASPAVNEVVVNDLIAKLKLLPDATPEATLGLRLRYVGDYELLEELGRGGMGVVFKAKQLSLQRLVAIKMILAGQLASPDSIARFRAEAEAAAHLDHPNLVPVFEVGEHQGQQYYSMKLIEGQSLAELRSNWAVVRSTEVAGKVSLSEIRQRERTIAELVRKLALAVHHAHQHGVLHRDLKPANVLIDRENQPHVTDFGLAKTLDSQAGMTATGVLVGTPSYMSPEQAAGRRDVTTAVDVYGLGAILYELLTGKPPFQGESSARVLQRVIDTDPLSPHQIERRLDRDLATICLKCLRKEPGERYLSAAAMSDDLQRYLTGEPILARPISNGERLAKWARRKPALAALVAVSSLGTVALLVGLLISNAIVSKARRTAEKALVDRTAALNSEQHASYIKTIAMAQQDIVDNDVRHAMKLLDECDPAKRDWEWHYLMRKCRGTYHRLRTKLPQCHDLAYSSDGRLLAALVVDPKRDKVGIEVWDAKTEQPLITLIDPVASAKSTDMWRWTTSVAFSRDGKQLAYTAYETVEGKRRA